MEQQTNCDTEGQLMAFIGQQRVRSAERQKHLRAVVDMGSNGIRFSITDLAPPTARVLPTVFSSREDIGLYDAQFDLVTGEKIPIPQLVIDAVIGAILRFKAVCSDYRVPDEHIRITATEATRRASNSEEFRQSVLDATGLRIEMLPKEEEGRVGAWGIASGFSKLDGLLLDLGGGSSQISWIVSRHGEIEMSPKGSFSFPYGAAAMTRTLRGLREGKSKDEAAEALAQFRAEMKANYENAYQNLEIPEEMVEKAKQKGGFPMYLSGGGFRGWGYLILYLNQQGGREYPISIINGYTADKREFEDTEALKHAAKSAKKIFRVSDRRRAQVPAVAFLIDVLSEAIPHGIREVHFCQGGVREGVLFKDLPPEIRKQDPLEVVTMAFARPASEQLYKQLRASIPAQSTEIPLEFPPTVSHHVVRAFINVLYVHAPMGKESASTSALYSTSTGIMASAHGIAHKDRALLALMLEERYEGDLPPREVDFKENLSRLLTREEIWWSRYLGRVGQLLAAVYPAGTVADSKPRISTTSKWSSGMGKKGRDVGIRLSITVMERPDSRSRLRDTVQEHGNSIEKVGKKKHWIGEEPKWGMRVSVEIENQVVE